MSSPNQPTLIFLVSNERYGKNKTFLEPLGKGLSIELYIGLIFGVILTPNLNRVNIINHMQH